MVWTTWRHTELDGRDWYEIASILLDKGVNVNGEMPDRSPLRTACEHGSLQVVRLLLERGADVHADNVFGEFALNGSNAELASLLLAARTDVVSTVNENE